MVTDNRARLDIIKTVVFLDFRTEKGSTFGGFSMSHELVLSGNGREENRKVPLVVETSYRTGEHTRFMDLCIGKLSMEDGDWVDNTER